MSKSNDDLTPEEQAELQQLMAGTPALKRWELLQQLHKEHPEYILLRTTLQPDPGARDPDRAPMKVDVRWSIRARGLLATQSWDAYVRHELKKRLGIEEPTSITEEQLATLSVVDRQP